MKMQTKQILQCVAGLVVLVAVTALLAWATHGRLFSG